MKAFRYEKYGPPKTVLKQVELEAPKPKPEEVLVRIKSTAVNDWDWSMITGSPKVYRIMNGLFSPKIQVPGMELSGVVEATGQDVSKFAVGDEVFGDTSDMGFGTYAEFMAVSEKALVKKPLSMPFDDAASIPHASLLAWQSFFDVANLQQGEKVMINGGGGGVGTLGFQIANNLNCEVSGVDTGNKLEKMDQLGFKEVIDYKKEDFTKSGVKYDLIVDCKTTRPASAYAKALSSKGRYVTVGGTPGRLISLLASRLTGRKNIFILGLKPNKGLEQIIELYEKGKIKTVIDGPHPFEKTPDLVRYFGEGKHTGKVIISVG